MDISASDALTQRGWQLDAPPVITYYEALCQQTIPEEDEVTKKAIKQYENERIEKLVRRYEIEAAKDTEDEEFNENARQSLKSQSKAYEHEASATNENCTDELDYLTAHELSKLNGKEFCIALIQQVQAQINQSKRDQERNDVLDSVTNKPTYRELSKARAGASKGTGFSTFRKVAKQSAMKKIGLGSALNISDKKSECWKEAKAHIIRGVGRKQKRKVKELLTAWQRGSLGLAHAMSPTSFKYKVKQS
jgi:hypothetical protein